MYRKRVHNTHTTRGGVGAGEAQTDLFLFCRPLRLPQLLIINKATKSGKLDRLGVCGRNVSTGHVWVQLNARGLYLLVKGRGKKGVTINRHGVPFIIQKLAAGWPWSPGYCPVRPSCSSPSSRRAQHRGTRGGTARGKKGEGSDLKRSLK